MENTILSRPRSLRLTNDHRLNLKKELLRNQKMAEVFSLSSICLYIYIDIFMYSWLLSLIHLNTMWSWLKNGIPRRPKKAEMLVFLLKILYFSSIVFGNCHVLGVCSFRGWLLNPLEKWRTGSSSGNHGHLFLESNGRFLSFNLPRMVVAACTFWVFWDAVTKGFWKVS